MRIEPTAAQQRVLDAIRTYIDAHGFAPAVRDLAAELDLSTSTVHYHLDRLADEGWIEREPDIARSIRLTEYRPAYQTA